MLLPVLPVFQSYKMYQEMIGCYMLLKSTELIYLYWKYEVHQYHLESIALPKYHHIQYKYDYQ